MIGKRFNRWTVIAELKERSKCGAIKYECVCDCGTIRKIFRSNLRSGQSKSCGCIQKEATHGMRGTCFYTVWKNLRQRCDNANSPAYKHYGGRGITYDKRWDKFENFRDDMYEAYKEHVAKHGEDNTSIDRINNDGNYEPDNCRWATRTQQVRNQRMRTDNTSGVTGVHWHIFHEKWFATIRVDNKQIHLGYFSDFDLAVEARKEAEAMYFNIDSIA